MRPLVNYARWQGARLRLLGRDEAAVWGQLVWPAGAEQEKHQDFRFNLKTWELILDAKDNPQLLQLDEMGVVVGRGEREQESGGAEEQEVGEDQQSSNPSTGSGQVL